MADIDVVLDTVGASILGFETYGFFIFDSLVLLEALVGLASSRASALLCLACSVDILVVGDLLIGTLTAANSRWRAPSVAKGSNQVTDWRPRGDIIVYRVITLRCNESSTNKQYMMLHTIQNWYDTIPYRNHKNTSLNERTVWYVHGMAHVSL